MRTLSPLINIAATAWAAFSTASAQVSQAAAESILTDKTLVVWAAPANLTQRGGSVLTIEDGREHFDAIVFGELAPSKWMAGSDFFRRTPKDQAGFPTETADAKTFVQIATVYAGKTVTVFRDGRQYSQHTMAKIYILILRINCK